MGTYFFHYEIEDTKNGRRYWNTMIVPDTIPVDDLLEEMQQDMKRSKAHKYLSINDYYIN